MREDDIQRYGRQILLKELGGRGQAKLMARGVVVRGEGPGISDAVTYLTIGGTPVSQGSGVVLASVGGEVPSSGDVVLLGCGVAWRTAAACDACWAQTRERLAPLSTASVVIGSLAALTVQRVVLGWADPLGLVTWDGAKLVSGPPARCELHQERPEND